MSSHRIIIYEPQTKVPIYRGSTKAVPTHRETQSFASRESLSLGVLR